MKKFLGMLVVLMVLISAVSIPADALTDGSPTYYLTNGNDGTTVNTGKDNGYSGSDRIEDGDPHFGWSLGKFTMNSYTDVVYEDGIPVFLVNPGDSVVLGYQLSWNIDQLGNKENYRISSDKNGYDNAYGIEKSDNGFGRGTLLVRYTSFANDSTVTVYRDYLAAVQGKTANTDISFMEEGDYTVALDYEVASPVFLGTKYTNYRTTFQFKVRNSSCIVFLRETGDTAELANNAVAEKGFFLDYANSHYLKVDVVREILTDNGYGRSKTVRSCERARNGVFYTEDGIYTVTVKNQYTGEEITMVVSVGEDPIMNAYVTSQCIYEPEEISRMVEDGQASITDDWRIEMVEQPEPEPLPFITDYEMSMPESLNAISSSNSWVYILISGMVIGVTVITGTVFCFMRKSGKRNREHISE